MSKQPQSRWKRIVTLGAGLALLIAAGTLLAEELRPTSASSGGPEMRLTADGCTANCTFATGETFTLAVEIVESPAGGYVGAQSFLNFGTDMTYTPAAAAADEVIWADCAGLTVVRAQFDGLLPPGATTDYTVNHGCLSGLLPPQPLSNFTGNFLELEFACSAEDSQTVVLQLPYEEEPVITTQETSGSAFGVPVGTRIVNSAPKLTNLTIICGEPPPGTPLPTVTPGGATYTPTPAATETPTPAVTAAPSPTITPTPTTIPRPCGDVNGDGAVNSQDALWVLWLASGVIDYIPFPDDLDGDGTLGAIDALLILQIEANLFICR